MSPQGKPIAPPQAQRKAANGREYMAAYYLQTYPYPCDDVSVTATLSVGYSGARG